MASQGDNNSISVANKKINMESSSSFSFKSCALNSNPKPFYGAVIKPISLPPLQPTTPPPPPAEPSNIQLEEFNNADANNKNNNNLNSFQKVNERKGAFRPIDSAGDESSTEYVKRSERRVRTPVSYIDSTDDDAYATAGEMTDNESRTRYVNTTMKEKESKGLAIRLPGLGMMSFQNKAEHSAFHQASSHKSFSSKTASKTLQSTSVSTVQQQQQQQFNEVHQFQQQQYQQFQQQQYQQQLQLQQIQQQQQEQLLQFHSNHFQQQQQQFQLQENRDSQSRQYLQRSFPNENVSSSQQTQRSARTASFTEQQQQQNSRYEEYNREQLMQSTQLFDDYNLRNSFASEQAARKTNEPQFVKPLPNFLRFSAGQPARLDVEVNGQPTPVVTWFKDNMVIRNTADTQISSNLNAHTLRLPEIYVEDSGLYKVIIASALGKSESVCEVIVEEVIRNTFSRNQNGSIRRKNQQESDFEQTTEINQYTSSQLQQQQQQVTQSQNIETNGFYVEQLKKPQFAKHLHNLAFRTGDAALIQCVAISTPDTDVKWFLNGALIESNNNYVMAYDFYTGLCTLSIASAVPTDSGQYTCLVSNCVGSESSNCWVVVRELSNVEVEPQFQPAEEPPQPQQPQPQPTPQPIVEQFTINKPALLQPLNNVEFYEADSALFECRVQGHYLNIQWFKGNQPLENPFRYKMSYDELSGMARLFIATCLREDAGEYTCQVANKVGETSSTAHLILIEPIVVPPPPPPQPIAEPEPFYEPEPQPIMQQELFQPFIPEPPPVLPPKILTPEELAKLPAPAKILRGLKNEQVNEGEIIVLRAIITGNPFPRCSWFKNNQSLVLSQRHFVYEEESKKICGIKIKNACGEDSGIYSLVADNTYGTDDSSAQVVVIVKSDEVIAKETMSAPFFVEHLKISQSLLEGQDSQLTCSWAGSSATVIQWQRNGKVLTPDGNFKIEVKDTTSTLFIKNARQEDGGLFACIIANDAGSNMSRCQVNVSSKHETHLDAALLKRIDGQQVTSTLQNLKHVSSQKNQKSQVQFGTWSKEISEEEMMYDRDCPRPPKFLTQFKPQLDLKERQAARFYAKLIPVGDPTIKFTWLKNGEPLRSATRYEIKYEFGLVSFDIQWTYPEDDGVYECIAKNEAGEDRTKAELKCRSNRLVIFDSQLPEGHSKVQDIEEKRKVADLVREVTASEDAEREPTAPEILLKLVDTQVEEGSLVKFMAKITGYPKPRVSWFVNQTTAISGVRFRTYFDGMIHYLDIPKTNKAEHEGTIRLVAKNFQGATETSCQLKIIPKLNYRSVLKITKSEEEKKEEAEIEAQIEARKAEALKALEAKHEQEHKEKHKEHVPLKPRKVQKVADDRLEPSFTKHPPNLNVIEGATVEISAEFTGVPPVREVFWYKDGLQMESSVDFHIESTATKSLLRIREAYKSDSAIYTVKLFNLAGVAQSKSYLAVNSAQTANLAPKFTLDLESVTVKSGESVKFKAQAKGEPAPNLFWLKNDNKLEMTERITESIENNTNVLSISNVTLADVGCYECLAVNQHGKQYSKGFLNLIIEKPVVVEEPPKPAPRQVKKIEPRSKPAAVAVPAPVTPTTEVTKTAETTKAQQSSVQINSTEAAAAVVVVATETSSAAVVENAVQSNESIVATAESTEASIQTSSTIQQQTASVEVSSENSTVVQSSTTTEINTAVVETSESTLQSSTVTQVSTSVVESAESTAQSSSVTQVSTAVLESNEISVQSNTVTQVSTAVVESSSEVASSTVSEVTQVSTAVVETSSEVVASVQSNTITQVSTAVVESSSEVVSSSVSEVSEVIATVLESSSAAVSQSNTISSSEQQVISAESTSEASSTVQASSETVVVVSQSNETSSTSHSSTTTTSSSSSSSSVVQSTETVIETIIESIMQSESQQQLTEVSSTEVVETVVAE